MRTRLLWLSTAALWATACGPNVKAFDVMPRSLCPGQQARVTFSVSGTPTVLVRLTDPRIGVAEPDEALALAPDTLEFVIVATKGDKESRPRRLDVLQYADSGLTEVVFPTRPVGDSLVADGDKNPVRWSESFRVRSVTSASGRELVASHGDRTVTLDAAGTPSDMFAGLPVQGRWELRTAMSSDERATPSLRPDRLRIDLVLACAEGQR